MATEWPLMGQIDRGCVPQVFRVSLVRGSNSGERLTARCHDQPARHCGRRPQLLCVRWPREKSVSRVSYYDGGKKNMRHALGVLGVLAASVLLVVSAAMNWRFGYSLGHSELDSQLLGLASAASDCLKALIPFFLFAALRNRQWSQAAAAGLLWGVCLTYSLTSALGFSAMNRADTTGQRVAEAAAYGDLRTELDKARERLNWVPQHRPADMVAQEVEVQKQNRRWDMTKSCTDVTTSLSKAFCGQYHELLAELGAAQEADKLQSRIDEVRGKLTAATSGAALAATSDPQVDTLSNLSGQTKTLVQTGLILMVAILVELGSSLGFYVVFSNWKIYEDRVRVPAKRSETFAEPITITPVAPALPAVAALTEAPALPIAANANDNRQAPARLQAPEGNVQRYYKEKVVSAEGANLTASELYEDYTDWCNDNRKEPEALTTFGRELSELGVQKIKFNGKMRYIGIKLPHREREEAKYRPDKVANAA